MGALGLQLIIGFSQCVFDMLHPLQQPGGVDRIGIPSRFLPHSGVVLGQEGVHLRGPGAAGHGELDTVILFSRLFHCIQSQLTLKVATGPGGVLGTLKHEAQIIASGGNRRGQPGGKVGGSQGTAVIADAHQHPLQFGDGRLLDHLDYLVQCLGKFLRVYGCLHAALLLFVF